MSEGNIDVPNPAAEGISYYTPRQEIPAGAAYDPQDNGTPIPKLFKPLEIRRITLHNRIMLSPLCQYSAENGHHTAWHFTHLGGIIQRGPGISFVEATSVTAEGRITPEDSGLWLDSQGDVLAKTVEFAHSQNQKIGIQLAHAGRKASTVAPWLKPAGLATKAVHGWPDNVYAPSAIPYNPKYPIPKEMTKADIESFKEAFAAAVKRALKAGFDAIEIHNAHGYLLHSFLSPVTNHRRDEYGGSFENRIRLTVEVADLVRANVPKDFPVFLRISATDFLEDQDYPSWKIEDTVRLAEVLVDHGIDLIDVSAGGNSPAQKIPSTGPGYQVPYAMAVKKAVGNRMLVGSVGMINEGKQANKVLEDGIDLVICGRGFQSNPGLVWQFADDIGVTIHQAHQIRWGFQGRSGNKR